MAVGANGSKTKTILNITRIVLSRREAETDSSAISETFKTPKQPISTNPYIRSYIEKVSVRGCAIFLKLRDSQ